MWNVLSGAKNFLSGAVNKAKTAVGGLVKSAQSYLQPPQTQAALARPKIPMVSASSYAAHNPAGQVASANPRQMIPIPQPVRQQPQLDSTAQSYLGGSGGGYIPSYTPPSPESYGIQSQEAFNRKQAEAIGSAYGAIPTYLASRDPVAYRQERLQALGIPEKEAVLGAFEKDILKQQEQLETLPKEDLARRAETGMITQEQRNRVQAMEERPIREQLFKTGQAQQQAEVGYNRALQLVGQDVEAYNQQTQAAVQGLDAQARATVESAALMISGFSFDNQVKLDSYRQTEAAGYQLQAQQQQDKAQLTGQERTHAQATVLAANVTKEIQAGATLQQMMGKYLGLGLDPDLILSLYNANSRKWGPAKETSEQLTQRYGVSSGRGRTV